MEVWSPSRLGELYCREGTLVHIERKVAWAPGLAWTLSRREESVAPAGNRTPYDQARSLRHMTVRIYVVNKTKYEQKVCRQKSKLFKIRPNAA